ncbi:MAG: hypothetical protein A2015_16575 [Spirochaetes bacterium GWF1_31_7]|nr:MAG: hypothetical protein A2Y30_13940 [Spirochaetes bacterium GWE1_32_154]OHD50058.1 MAG: hypothetical protein A2Y29_11985 [Spirochaetes bacterium GWE2_31_10]OHD52372.1 MAG: hypothetical protein A2015_16575 [Spirochaetes bacterium GWF1_31_7]OHD81688.1 MAG: hypothetical protein A2355_07425 [Spirochaetes bacterium RIFOXYB1_FULL_32_8]HBD96014.1 hypothetical protein [Spirochaetia bacterium]
MKKIIASLLISFILIGCVSTPIPKQEVITEFSEPYKDFGTPLAGSFKNGQKIKGAMYITVSLLTLLTSLLFAPIQENGGSIIPMDNTISTPLSLSLLGVGISTALIISPIDTAISYHKRNQKIIDLNSIEWNKNSKLNKYNAILEHRANIKKNQIEKFKIRFAEGSITITDIYIIGSDQDLLDALKIEVEAYTKKLKEKKSQDVE